jgi:hypothetical protein
LKGNKETIMVLESLNNWRKQKSRYLIQRKKAEFEACPPYRVDVAAHFPGHWKYHYGNVGSYPTLPEAVQAANRITQDNLAALNSNLEKWRHTGDAGNVYDSRGVLVWSGLIEYGYADYLKYLSQHTDRGLGMLLGAIELAIQAHNGQVRKGTAIPYIIHPLRAAEILCEFNCYFPYLLAAAVLHDTIEDTCLSAENIRNIFGKKVYVIVKNLSQADKNMSWEERKADTINRLEHMALGSLWVECADKLDNIRAIHRDFNVVGEKLWDRFNRPKDQQQWYYQSIATALSHRKEYSSITRIIDAFIQEVEAVFGPRPRIC